jgi:alpha-tubulin suppressor-like RCC1 family protein
MAKVATNIPPMQRWVKHLLLVFGSLGSLGLSPYAQATPTIYSWGDGTPPHQLESLEEVVAISLGGFLKLKSDGTVWAGSAGAFTPVPILNHIVAISSSRNHRCIALQSDGTVWMWGNLDPTLATRNWIETPRPVEGLTDVTAIAAGEGFSLALKSDGTVWGWGGNDYGQLGIGGDHPAPVQVTGLSDVTALSVGVTHGLALKSDGTIWKWGDHVTTPHVAPLVTGVTAIAAGLRHDLALTADGSVWAWGANNYGQLGNGTTSYNTESPTPSRVQNLSNVIQISNYFDSNLALKADGTVWGWGREYTKLYLGEAVSTPRRVLDLPPVHSIVAGGLDASSLNQDVALTEPLDAASDHTPPETISSPHPPEPSYIPYYVLSPFSADYPAWEDRPYSQTDVVLFAMDPQGSGVRSLTYSATGADPVTETTVNGNYALLHLIHEGETTITYSATDEAGNVEPAKSVTVRVKTSLPVLKISGIPALTGLEPLHFTVTSDQPLSAPPKYGYRIDRGELSNIPPIEHTQPGQPTGEPNTYSFTFTPPEQGYYTLSVAGEDVAGNVGYASVDFWVDVTPPTIQIYLEGKQSGPNWFTSDVSLAVVSSDDYGYYSLDDPGCSPETWESCDRIILGFIPVTMEGRHTLYGFALNPSGLASAPLTLTFTINKTGPVAQSQSLALEENHPVEITLQSSDVAVKSLSYSVVAPPSHGVLSSINGDRVTYTPNSGYHGPDSFTFQASDGDFLGTLASVNLTVSPASAEGGSSGSQQGDVTGDAVVDVRDAVWLLRAITGFHVVRPEQRSAADTNCDGSVNLGDVVQLLRSILFGQILPACS